MGGLEETAYETSYSNREIDSFVTSIRAEEKQEHEQLQETMDRVEVQTLKTNGRVRWLEKMIYLAIGGLGVISLVVFPLLWALISSGKI